MMVALNFSPEFAGPVERREKRQTIRRQQRGKVGDAVQLYTGQRTKDCRKLSDVDPVLIRVAPVVIAPEGLYFEGHLQSEPDKYARLDGFKDYAAMLAWFQDRYGKPRFNGYEHRWQFPTHTTG